MIIRKAVDGDLTQILEIANSNSLMHTNKNADIESNGFLVSSFTLDDYQNYLKEAEYFFVAETQGSIKGFILAYPSDSIHEGDITNKLLESNMLTPFILIKQIVIKRDEVGRGVASALYSHLFKLEPENDYLAAIVTEPANSRSVAFHKKMGFQHHCDITPPPDSDGVVRNRSIWWRSARSGEQHAKTRLKYAEVSGSPEIIIENIHAAIGLYSHEDNLNWTKFGMLVTFMMALFAAFSYVFEMPLTTANLIISSMLIVFGYVINFLFLIKLKSGVMYMQSHKDNVKLLEARMLSLDSSYVPLIKVDGNELISGRSKTSTVLSLMPVLGMFLWTMSSIMMLLKQLGVIQVAI